MLEWILSIISVIAVSLLSMIGIITLWVNDKTLKKVLLYLVSFSAGSLFGDAFIHLIPQAIETNTSMTTVSLLILAGIFVSFIVERFFQWRHCHVPTSSEHPHSLAYMNLFGDAVHNLIDGIIIAGSFLVSIPLGFATSLAVIFHEIPQELGDFGVLIYGGFKKRKALWFNFLTALAAIVGALISLTIGTTISDYIPLVIPFAAGNFIYIAGSDLIPELRKDNPEPKKSALQMISITMGIAVMMMLLLIE